MSDPNPLIPGGNWWWKLIILVAAFAAGVLVLRYMNGWGPGPTIHF